jgi:hemerythrin-like metal-binding protein
MDTSHFEWKEEYSVKVALFDEQHKQLIKTVDDLYQAIFASKGKEVLSKVFASLDNYANIHFSDEEKYFQEFGYPDAATHKDLHEKFKKDIAVLEEKASDEAAPYEVLFFLENWWINHIMDIDKRYSVFFNSKGLH